MYEVFKLVTIRLGSFGRPPMRLSLCADVLPGNSNLAYSETEITYPKIRDSKIFAFCDEKSARKYWEKTSGITELWRAETETQPKPFSSHYIWRPALWAGPRAWSQPSNFWPDGGVIAHVGEHMEYIVITPAGTVLCDSIKLVENLT